MTDQTKPTAQNPDAVTPEAQPSVDEPTPAVNPADESTVTAPDQSALGAAESTATTDESSTSSDQEEAKPAKAKRVHPREVVERFAAVWPQAFTAEPREVKPLTVGVLKQILSERPEGLDGLNSQAIRAGMKFYASRLSYHIAMLNHSHRVDLSGEQAEEITDDMRQHAQEQIDAIKAQRQKKQAEKEATGEANGEKPARRPRKPRPPADGEPARTGNKPRRGDRNARNRTTGGPKSGSASRQGRSARQEPSSAPRESVAGLSMEEKLARLAQHFGHDAPAGTNGDTKDNAKGDTNGDGNAS